MTQDARVQDFVASFERLRAEAGESFLGYLDVLPGGRGAPDAAPHERVADRAC